MALLPIAGGSARPAIRLDLEARQSQGLRVAGGGPEGAELDPDPTISAALAELESAARAANPRSTRVSLDFLEPDGGTAEPEAQTEPFVAIDPEREGHLLAGFQEGRYPSGAARALSYAVSFDGGNHWTGGLLPALTVDSGGRYERASDPWVAFGPFGRAYFASLVFSGSSNENGILVSSSADGGLSWGSPVPVRIEMQGLGDKEAMVVDTRADSPFRGRVYVAWDFTTDDRHTTLRIASSDDEGGSFTAPVTIYDQAANIAVVPLVGPGGVVHAIWATYSIEGGTIDARLVSARSADGGESWTAPAEIAEPRPAGVGGSRTANGFPGAAIDPRNGNLYVAWQDQRFSPGIDQVVLSRSTDGGATWSTPQLVSDGPRNAASFTPAVAVNPNGVVGVAYYSLRNDPTRRVLVDEYLAISRDGGRKFAKSLRVSGASWDTRFAATSSDGYFLGDYQGLVAGRQTFHPLWIATFHPSRFDTSARQADAFTRVMKVK